MIIVAISTNPTALGEIPKWFLERTMGLLIRAVNSGDHVGKMGPLRYQIKLQHKMKHVINYVLVWPLTFPYHGCLRDEETMKLAPKDHL